MKKFLCILLIAVLVAGALPMTVLAAEVSFPVSEAVIVTAAEPTATDLYAANRLKYYLDTITGNDIAIVPDSQAQAAYEISVGATSRTEAGLSERTDGSYSITSTKETIIINGAGNKGTINGVFAFLEKYCDCHWYEENVIIIPKNSTLSVPTGIDVEYTPFFEYTETDTKSAYDPEFSLANGLTGGIYRNLTAEQGGAVEYLGPSSHSLVNFYCKPADYFEAHPEYYALREGERVANQLCLTNEDVKEIVTKEVLSLLAEKHDPAATLQIVSITQHDNGDYCECDSCKALDEENGSQSGTMLTFVNDIASRVTASGNYDNVAFDTFAYQYTRKAPTKVIPREDVIVRLCSIECCFGHALDDKKCKDNVAFMEDLSAWSKICNRLYIWDYVLNCDESVDIHPNFGVLQRNIQVFYEHNVKGIYEQGIYYFTNCNTEFSEMRTYLLSKLMQNPYLDYDAEMLGYMTAVYGPGGKHLKEFIDITIEHAVTRFGHLHLEESSRWALHGMSKKIVKQCDALWESAKQEAESDEQLTRIRCSELAWRYWKCSNFRSEFSYLQHPYLWMKARQDLYDDFIAMGVTRMGERQKHDLSMDNAFNHLFRHIYTWITLYDEDFLQPLNRFAVRVYEFMENLYNLMH